MSWRDSTEAAYMHFIVVHKLTPLIWYKTFITPLGGFQGKTLSPRIVSFRLNYHAAPYLFGFLCSAWSSRVRSKLEN